MMQDKLKFRRAAGIGLRYFVLPAAAIASVAGLDFVLSVQPTNAAVSPSEWPKGGFGPRTYADAMLLTSQQLALGEERYRNGPDQWLRQESLARALMARARISASYDELAEANRLLAAALDNASGNSGPLLSQAVAAMSAHRLSDVQTALNTIDSWSVAPSEAERAEIEGLRGDIAFYRGDFAASRQNYLASHALEGGTTSYRLAQWTKSAGDFDQSIAWLQGSGGAPAGSTPFGQANTAMQIGAVQLARGNYPLARDWFSAANGLFSGYWLFEAHLAQAKALDGDLAGAIVQMRQIAQRAQSAEVMDALAMLLRTNGDATESRQWASRAGELWQRRLTQLPEAAYGHAVEHELVFGTPARALELAKLNLAARPFGEARILLASAMLVNGNTQGALSQLDLAEQSGWRSAPLYAVRAQALELSGMAADAVKARDAALALNPRIFDAVTALVWFSHG